MLMVVVQLAACTQFSSRSASSTPSRESLSERVDRLAAQYLRERPNGALVVGLLKSGQRHVKGYGRLGTNEHNLPDEKSLFEIGSITKVFTAIALAQGVEEENLKLEDPIGPLLGESAELTNSVASITLLQLATHQSGMPRLPPSLFQTVTNPANPYVNYHAADLYADLGKTKLTHSPGKAVLYSNYGFGLLGHLLELRSGQSFHELMRDTICLPLGLTNTAIRLSSAQQERLVPGHTPKGEPQINWDFSCLAGAGALRSTAEDMLAFLEINLNPGPSPLSAALKRAQSIHFKKARSGLGLGWHYLKLKEGPEIYWHNGGTGGYRSYAAFDRVHQTAVIVMSNMGDGMAGNNDVDKMGLEIISKAATSPWEAAKDDR